VKVAWPSPGVWPVTLRHEALVLRPLVVADEPAWNELRTFSSAWLAPWDATAPPETPRRDYVFADMVRSNQKLARQGRSLPWCLAWDDQWAAGSSGRPLGESGRPRLGESWWPLLGDSGRPLLGAAWRPLGAAWRPRLIGSLTVNGIVWGSSRSAFIGYWIDRRWAGRGLVPLGVAMAADYCFHTLKLHRLEIDILPENGPSHRVVQKLGFIPDGRRRSMLHIDGAWRDHDAFVMTADDAPASLVDRLLASGVVG